MELFILKFNYKNIQEEDIIKQHVLKKYKILALEIGEKDGLL
jgi:hypothetical protein